MVKWPKLSIAALRRRSFKVLPVPRGGYFRGRHGYFGRAAQKPRQQESPLPKGRSLGGIQGIPLRWLADEGFQEGADYTIEGAHFGEGYGLNIRMRYPLPVVMSVAGQGAEYDDAGWVFERIRILGSGAAPVRLRARDLEGRLDDTMRNALVGLEVF